MDKIIEKYLRKALELAQKSYDSGAFPAGAVIVKGDEVIAESISAKYPEIIFHAESQTIDHSMNKLHAQLSNCVMYTSMQPCLMCLSRAYWAGIREIYYVIKKEHTDYRNYESTFNQEELLSFFNEKMKVEYISDLEDQALKIVNKWESKNYK